MPNALAPLVGRHDASRINKDSPPKAENTIILPGTDIRPDLQAIREGRAMRDGPYYVVNGRYYGIHEGGRAYPVQGPGLMTLDRGAFRALGVYNSLGDTPDAEQRLDRQGITQDQRRAARSEGPMTIWRTVFVEAEVSIVGLARGLAGALDVGAAQVAAVVDTPDGWPAWAEGYEVVAEVRPACGGARLLATLFLFRDPAAVRRVDDGAVMQALADRLGCAVLLPDETDTDPFNYLRFRPGSTADRVSLDPDALDEHPPRVVVFGPACPLAEVAA